MTGAAFIRKPLSEKCCDTAHEETHQLQRRKWENEWRISPLCLCLQKCLILWPGAAAGWKTSRLFRNKSEPALILQLWAFSTDSSTAPKSKYSVLHKIKGCNGSAVVLTQQFTEQDCTEDVGNRPKLSRGISLSFSENNTGTIPRSSIPQEVRYSSSESQEVHAGVCRC